MRCPKCTSEQTSVKQTVRITGESKILRRRLCDTCGHKFQTTEEPNTPAEVKTTTVAPEEPVATPIEEEEADKPSRGSTSRKRKPPTKKSDESE